ncbi:endonuclease SmrB [Thorsellia anophelis]|uniref:Ribosome rescue factor SmrB n=1 Tax=Thorsellia anophelis DSM 18579 TaxID=1123402 RepID=A0A1I0CKS5_9GAMM|nr:endonuclease SmrB [Thorsellia anophelis]SET20066.1 DNA-nicking endonuclease, Smr domain [Thorsellia anophelis DSM 18579]
MNKNQEGYQEDCDLFKNAVKGAKKIKQDVVVHATSLKKMQKLKKFDEIDSKIKDEHYFQFSDMYQPNLPTEGPMRFIQPNVESFELKKLRRGDYVPELFLDVHGLTQIQAKREISALIEACKRENVLCACIMHGHGKNILKQNIPYWLAQHPDVLAFHQANKEWGGEAALLVLLSTDSTREIRR